MSISRFQAPARNVLDAAQAALREFDSTRIVLLQNVSY